MEEAFLEADLQANFTTLERFITAIALNNLQIDSIILLNDQAKEVFKLNRTPDQDVADFLPPEKGSRADYSAWGPVSQVLSGERIVSHIRLQGVTGPDDIGADDMLYTIGLIKREDEGGNEIIGVVLVGSYLRNSLANIKLTTLTDATFYDEQGQIRATTFPQAEATDLLAVEPEFYKQVVTNLEIAQTSQVDFSGQQYALIFAPFQLRGGTVGIYSIALRTDIVITVGVVSRNLFIAIIFITLAILLLMTFMLTRQIIEPLTQLAQTTQAIAAGDLKRQTGVKRGDEIGALAAAFDGITAQLREKSEQLRRLVKSRETETGQREVILSAITEGVIILDQNGQVSSANPVAQRILTIVSREHPSVSTFKSFLAFMIAKIETIETIEIQDGLEMDAAFVLSEFEHPNQYAVGRHIFKIWAVPVQGSTATDVGAVIILHNVSQN